MTPWLSTSLDNTPKDWNDLQWKMMNHAHAKQHLEEKTKREQAQLEFMSRLVPPRLSSPPIKTQGFVVYTPRTIEVRGFAVDDSQESL